MLGLPDLRPADAQKVQDGNLYMRFSVFILTLALALGLPFSMENPATSRIWICPSVLRLLRRKMIFLSTVEYCMCGVPWRKSTKFLSVHFKLDLLAAFRCLGAKRGLCKRTQRPHWPLAGVNDKGVFWTHIAEPYPLKLCNLICKCLGNFFAERRAQEFESRL